MTAELSRRALLAGAAAGLGGAAFAKAPGDAIRPVPRGAIVPGQSASEVSERIVKESGLDGVVTFALLDAVTGESIDGRQYGRPMPPASTLKAVTSIYALERLGGAHVFKTELLSTGPITGGKLEGDLILAGGGDPTLDTDQLADLAIALREAGVNEVTGRFFVWAEALPRGNRIDYDQPEHVAYNPAYCGLNLNFNRV
ncbi:MAG: D-alanyl-D-alanine carboxypeptidase, partial [Pseudomonadota bacterium]